MKYVLFWVIAFFLSYTMLCVTAYNLRIESSILFTLCTMVSVGGFFRATKDLS